MDMEETLRQRYRSRGYDPVTVENRIRAALGDKYKGISESEMTNLLTLYRNQFPDGSIGTPSPEVAQSFSADYWDKWAQSANSDVVDPNRLAGFRKAVNAPIPGGTFLSNTYGKKQKSKKTPKPKSSPSWSKVGSFLSTQGNGQKYGE